jgi:Lipin/Ned1/Smp2 multi-domain protein middle domain
MPPSGEHVHPVDGPRLDEGEEDADIHFGRGGWLTSDNGNGGYVLEFKGRITRFDLSLCGDVMQKTPEEADALFMQKRVPFQRFIDDPSIVHKDELTIRWRGRYVGPFVGDILLMPTKIHFQNTIFANSCRPCCLEAGYIRPISCTVG